MGNVVFMTAEQVSELVGLARNNPAIWEEVKLREIENEKRLSDAAEQGLQFDDRNAVFDPRLVPTLPEIAAALIRERYGAHHDFETGTLIVALRRDARLELELPV